MIEGVSPIVQSLLASLFTWTLTAFGSAFVFFLKCSSFQVLDGCLGFSAGIMTAASFWSLLQPAIDVGHQLYGSVGFLSVVVGFLSGSGFVYLCDATFDHVGLLDTFAKADAVKGPKSGLAPLEDGRLVDEWTIRKRRAAATADSSECEEERPTSLSQWSKEKNTSWRRILLLVIAITVHNVPEGLAVGVGFAASVEGGSYTFAKARSLAIGIGLQNFPEGLAVSLPLAAFGHSKRYSFFWGQLSGMVEPLAALLGALSVTTMQAILPFALSFAAGAMIYVVFDDVVPESQSRGNGQTAIWSLIIGFVIMMALDTMF